MNNTEYKTDVEVVASFRIDFNYDAQLAAAYKRLEGGPAEGDQQVAHAIVGRNMLVAKMAAMSQQGGYRMDHRLMKQLLAEINDCDVILASAGEV